jgi:hypothetical protein
LEAMRQTRLQLLADERRKMLLPALSVAHVPGGGAEESALSSGQPDVFRLLSKL